MYTSIFVHRNRKSKKGLCKFLQVSIKIFVVYFVCLHTFSHLNINLIYSIYNRKIYGVKCCFKGNFPSFCLFFKLNCCLQNTDNHTKFQHLDTWKVIRFTSINKYSKVYIGCLMLYVHVQWKSFTDERKIAMRRHVIYQFTPIVDNKFSWNIFSLNNVFFLFLIRWRT